MNESKIVLEAEKIAIQDLRSNYGDLGIYAGPKNHHEYWARDSFFASFGACVLGDFDIVRKNLELFRTYQAKNGQIPLRVEERSHPLNFIGIKVSYKPTARFKSSQPWATDVVDASALYIISACNYVKESGDIDWFNRNKDSLLKAFDWLLSRVNNLGLLDEGLTGNWADMTFKSGSVAYTNICFWKAATELSKYVPDLETKAKKLNEAINLNLWVEKKGYFADWISRGGKVYDYFFIDGNLLAVMWSLTNLERGKSIFNFIDINSLNKVPVVTCYPRLVWWMHVLTKIIFPPYNPQNIFAWWGPIDILCRFNIGDNEGASKDLLSLSKIIVKNGNVEEVMDANGIPVSLFFYKSEKRIAWGAGLFVYTINQFKREKMI